MMMIFTVKFQSSIDQHQLKSRGNMGNAFENQVCSIALILFCVILDHGLASASNSHGHLQDLSSASSSSSSSPSSETYSSPPEYQFRYGVYDSQHGNDFGHEEQRNGLETRGRYKVQLPDGRVQVVSYVADRNGYRADVTYENSGHSSTSAFPSHSKSSSSFPSTGSSYATSESRNPGYSSASSTSSLQSSPDPGRSFSTLQTKINGRYYGY